jgi:MtN3 and saliva related transmembrane protein
MTDQIIGLMAAMLTTLGVVTQALKVHETQTVGDLSLAMYSLFTLGVFLWLVYGIRKRDIPIILANGITLIASSYTLLIIFSKSS